MTAGMAMVTTSAAQANLLSGCFGIDPREHPEYRIEDPVLIVSHNSMYYAPEEIMAVPLSGPTIITFGCMPTVKVKTSLPRIHLELPSRVQDRAADAKDRTFLKQVDLAELHGAILFRDQTLMYKHLCDSPTVVAQPIMASRVIRKPGMVLPIQRAQTIGIGASTDAFGGLLWWYYFRVASLSTLKGRALKACAAGRSSL
jgi:hypothetical protein